MEIKSVLLGAGIPVAIVGGIVVASLTASADDTPTPTPSSSTSAPAVVKPTPTPTPAVIEEPAVTETVEPTTAASPTKVPAAPAPAAPAPAVPAPVAPADVPVAPAPAFTPEPGVQYGTAENPWPVPDMSGSAPGEILNPPADVPSPAPAP